MPCCTDRLSLMAGTYGSVTLFLVLTERNSVTTCGLGGLLSFKGMNLDTFSALNVSTFDALNISDLSSASERIRRSQIQRR